MSNRPDSVEGKIVVESKAVEASEKVHFAIVRSYLKAVGLSEDGLILTFLVHAVDHKTSRRERGFGDHGPQTVKNSCVSCLLDTSDPSTLKFTFKLMEFWHQFPKGTR